MLVLSNIFRIMTIYSCLIVWMWWQFAIGSGILHLSCWRFPKNLVTQHQITNENKQTKKKLACRYYERWFPWSGPGFGLGLNSMLYLFKINSLAKKGILSQSPQHIGNDIFLTASNLNILLPSLAKNILWILDCCVELIFQLKFTLLLILHFILAHSVMSFYVKGKCISFLPVIGYQPVYLRAGKIRGIHSRHIEQGDPCPMFKVSSVPATLAHGSFHEWMFEESGTTRPLSTGIGQTLLVAYPISILL